MTLMYVYFLGSINKVLREQRADETTLINMPSAPSIHCYHMQQDTFSRNMA